MSCNSTQSVSSFALLRIRHIVVQLVALQYISACHLQSVANRSCVLLNGVTFCHILIAAVCGHGHGHGHGRGHVIIISDNHRLPLIVGL
jgi:hypothetical protein